MTSAVTAGKWAPVDQLPFILHEPRAECFLWSARLHRVADKSPSIQSDQEVTLYIFILSWPCVDSCLPGQTRPDLERLVKITNIRKKSFYHQWYKAQNYSNSMITCFEGSENVFSQSASKYKWWGPTWTDNFLQKLEQFWFFHLNFCFSLCVSHWFEVGGAQ